MSLDDRHMPSGIVVGGRDSGSDFHRGIVGAEVVVEVTAIIVE